MTIKNFSKIKLNFKIKTFKLKDEFKISRVSKKIIKVIDISLKDGVNSAIAECVPYQRYNEKLDDILKYLRMNKDKLEKIIIDNRLEAIPFLSLQNTLSTSILSLKQKKRKVNFFTSNKIKKKIVTSITIPIFDLKKTKKILKKFTKTKIIKIKLNQKEVIDKLILIKEICPKSKIIIDANESWSKPFLQTNIKKLEQFNILFIEQPFPQGKDHYLKNIKSKINFCADESFHIKNKNLIKNIQHYNYVNLKLDKFGTHENILKYIAIAKKLKKKIMLGCMVSSSLSIYPALRYFNNCSYHDLDGAYFLKKDRLRGITYRDGLAKINFKFYQPKKKAP